MTSIIALSPGKLTIDMEIGGFRCEMTDQKLGDWLFYIVDLNGA
ncbi:hypothetical protein [Microcoleus sp. FACHB-672]|nr:hypothetical protein [Microcoleus sp. FACHB-672]